MSSNLKCLDLKIDVKFFTTPDSELRIRMLHQNSLFSIEIRRTANVNASSSERSVWNRLKTAVISVQKIIIIHFVFRVTNI